MNKYGAVLSSMGESFIICEAGSGDDLSVLYGLLEGAHLLGFCKCGLIVEESMKPFEEL